MKVHVKRVCLALAVSCLLSLGCRQSGPPTPLPPESISAEFGKAFEKGPPSVKELSSRVLATLQTNDYAAAYLAVQELCAAPEASKAQKELAARALLTITGLLQAAQSQGDQKAAETLQLQKTYR